MTPFSLTDAYLRFMLPPSQAQTKYLRLLWWSRIKDHYILCGTLGYECVFKRVIIGATLSQINQLDAFQRQFRIIFAFTSNSPRGLSPSVLFKPKDIGLCISRVYSGHRFFFILIGLAIIETSYGKMLYSPTPCRSDNPLLVFCSPTNLETDFAASSHTRKSTVLTETWVRAMTCWLTAYVAWFIYVRHENIALEIELRWVNLK